MDSVNDHGTLFGGIALKWMDEVAYIAATRYTNQKMVTVKVDHVRFRTPVYPGNQVEIRGFVNGSGTVKLKVWVEIRLLPEHDAAIPPSVEGQFTFTAINESGRPVGWQSGNQ